jgi:hypothetical protein
VFCEIVIVVCGVNELFLSIAVLQVAIVHLLDQKYLVPQFSQPLFKPEDVLSPRFFGASALPICLACSSLI